MKTKTENRKQFYCMMVMLGLCFISLIPLLYCAMFDYATGDDLFKSASVHQLIDSGASIAKILSQAGWEMVEVWKAHEGTWASNFILAMQPGIWGEKFYSITPIIGLLSLFLGTGTFLYEVIVRIYEYSKNFFLSILFALMIIMTQYMPYIRGGLFWFTGMAHYTLPFGIAIFLLALDIKYLREGNNKLIPAMVMIGIYIGGSHYQAILLVILMQIFFVIIYYKKDKISYLIAIAVQIILELIGFIICAKAPGNAERAGDEFGFSSYRVVYTILKSIKSGILDGIEYWTSIKLIPVYFILIVAGVMLFGKKRNKKIFLIYPVTIIVSFLVYCAMYAPGVYYSTFDADEGISGGFYDFNYFSFMIFITVFGIMIGEIITFLLKSEVVLKSTYGLGILALIILVVFGKSVVKDSADYMIYNYVKDGHLKDFDNQMRERFRILQDDTVDDAVLPEMNSEQGPFMHMALTKDVNNFTNYATKLYYGKKSVIAIPRDEYLLQKSKWKR